MLMPPFFAAFGLALGAGFATAQAPPAGEAPAFEALMLRLRGGAIEWAGIVEHSPTELTVRRLDNGGVARLSWGMLDPAQEHELRLRFGYVDVDGEEPMIQGHRVLFIDGTEILGLLVASDEREVTLKQESGSRVIAKAFVRELTTVQLPALEVYTKEELYLQELGKLAQRGDEDSAAAHFELARFCESIFAFRQAEEHYRRAQELDPDFQPAEMAVILARVALKVLRQDQLDALAEADRMRRRSQYQRALQALAVFDATWPDTPLRVDRLKLEDRIVKSRAREVKELVRRNWYSWIDRIAGRAAREQRFQAAVAQVEGRMSEEILQSVTEDARRIWPEIDEGIVRQLWQEREARTWKAASYGLGTWLLGRENALKGGPESQPKERQGTELDRARDDAAARIKRFMQNQQMIQRAGRSAEDEQEIDDYWMTLSYAARKNWLTAHYAENSGDVQLRPRPELYNCQTCAGLGAREVLYLGDARSGSSGSGVSLVTCATCRGVGVVRRIRFR